MLKHIVMWKFKDFAEGKSKVENAKWMKENLESLIGVIPEIKSLSVGINIEDSDKMAYDAVLISTFENKEALEAYKINPLHKEISAYCKKVRECRTVVDYNE